MIEVKTLGYAGNRRGPANSGPLTGRGAGYCAGYNVPGYLNPLLGQVAPIATYNPFIQSQWGIQNMQRIRDWQQARIRRESLTPAATAVNVQATRPGILTIPKAGQEITRVTPRTINPDVKTYALTQFMTIPKATPAQKSKPIPQVVTRAPSPAYVTPARAIIPTPVELRTPASIPTKAATLVSTYIVRPLATITPFMRPEDIAANQAAYYYNVRAAQQKRQTIQAQASRANLSLMQKLFRSGYKR